MPKAIAINGRFAHRRLTGVERHARELSVRLQPPVRVVAPPDAAGRRHTWRARGAVSAIHNHLWEQFQLPPQLLPGEILWSPANSGPWVVSRQAVTLHDASPFDHPEWFRPQYGAWARLSWRLLARNCRAILTVSEFSRRRLSWHLKLPDGKLQVIPNGVGAPFKPVSQRAAGAFREKYSIYHQYFLFVGTLEPRKNLRRLLMAWELFGATCPGYDLLIAGERGGVFREPGYRALPPRVRLLHFVPEADLPALYAGAVATVLPSLYEGFCLPALESMACGTPVIASNNSCLPEVAADAAMLIDPVDAHAIAGAMTRLIEDHGLAEALRQRGLERAQQSSWDRAAHKLQSILRAD